MAANVDKVEENESEESHKLSKSGKSMTEIENQLDRRNVAYKIKDETDKGKDKETAPNTE
jgi:hypothetical protein